MKFIGIFASLLLAGFAMADGTPAVSIVNQVGVTNTVVGEYTYSGYIDVIYVDVTGVTTGTLTIASADETLLTATVTADATYRPRFITHNSSGVALAGGTNGYDRALLASEKLTYTLSETAGVTNSYSIKVKFVRDRP